MHRGCVLALTLLLAAACRTAHAVDTDAAPKAEISRWSLTLTFPQPMDSWSNATRDDWLTLAPALPTRCHWSSDTRLSCTFADDTKASAATRYRIRIPAGLVTRTGEALPAFDLEAETDRPKLRASIAKWNDGLPTLELHRDDDIETTAITGVLRLTIADVEHPVVLRDVPPEGRYDSGHTEVVLPASIPRDAKLVLAIRPGLKSKAGPLEGIQDEVLADATINERFRLREATCDTPRDGRKRPADARHLRCKPGMITLAFSRAPDADAIEAFARTLRAPMRLDTKRSDTFSGGSYSPRGVKAPSHAVLLVLDEPRKRARITLPASMRSGGDTLAEDVELRITTGDQPPVIASTYSRHLLAERTLPEQLAWSVNARDIPFTVDAIGHENAKDEGRTRGWRRNRPQPIHSAIIATAIAEGGWASLLPASEHSRSMEIAAPSIDLLAMSGRRDVIAWAHAWDDGRALGTIPLELLRDGRVVAEAVTGEDGVARFDLNATSEGDIDESSAIWAVRAHPANETSSLAVAVLALDHADIGELADEAYWGVTDRPLYRAGDTVRYRLWHREASGGRYLPTSRKAAPQLALRKLFNEKPLLTWPATSRYGDDLSGELALPAHLDDDDYCIGLVLKNDSYRNDDQTGACFFVGTHRAQDLWTDATSPATLLRDGDTFALDVEAGYYSGGAAAGVTVNKLQTMLTPLSPSVAFPAHAAYTFIDVNDNDADGGLPVADEAGLHDTTDAKGRARIEIPVRFVSREPESALTLPPFGLLKVTASVGLSDREDTVTRAAQVHYTRHDRFVGLRSEPAWFDATTPILFAAVVIDPQGQTSPDAQVKVEASFQGNGDEPDPASTQTLASCTLAGTAPTACDVARTRSGWYVFEATSGDAAPTRIARYVHVPRDNMGNRTNSRDREASLELLEEPGHAATTLRVVLEHAHGAGDVLFVFSRGDRILGHRTARVEGDHQVFAVDIPAEAQGEIKLWAAVRTTRHDVDLPAGYRVPPRVEWTSVDVVVRVDPEATSPIAIAFADATSRPGHEVRLTATNTSPTERDVVVAVMDDALRALAGNRLDYSDPGGPHWLGANDYTDNDLNQHDFSYWNQASWKLQVERPRDARRRTAIESAMPPFSIGSDRLETIVVTGSRIRRVDVFTEGQAPVRGVKERASAAGLVDDALRSRFADTAFWMPGTRLAPGESRAWTITLPDNLTRWRAVAWSSDDDGHFDMADSALESGLPLEARVQAPVRVFSGDEAVLAVHARQSGTVPRKVVARIDTEGDGVSDTISHRFVLAPQGQRSLRTPLKAHSPGSLSTTARIQGGGDRDAVGATTEVATTVRRTRRTQAGWITDAGVRLALPVLPEGTVAADVSIEATRGMGAWARQWIDDLRDYPHRCWEQILSRAVAAAIAIERGHAAWPDARAVVQEALDNSAVFQDHNGSFRYFPRLPGAVYDEERGEVALTAYSLEALTLLSGLGYAVREDVIDGALTFLGKRAKSPDGSDRSDVRHDDAVIAAAAIGAKTPPVAPGSTAWTTLSAPARTAVVRQLATRLPAVARDALSSLLAEAPLKAGARSFRAATRSDRWMGSDMAVQCTLIELVARHPDLAPPGTDAQLMRGLVDLHAGGQPAVDTQTGARCLIAARAAEPPHATAVTSTVSITHGETRDTLVVPATGEPALWRGTAPAGTVFGLGSETADKAALGFVATAGYDEEMREAVPSAMGLAIERHHGVLRDGTWVPVANVALRDSDWIRTTLVVTTAAPRHFVALTDSVAGGLQPTDLSLGGVAGVTLESVSDTGSGYFATRKLDPRSPRFYAEYLPAGTHEVHYFARVGNAGDYLAAPAVAELMYGNATHARTASVRLRIASTSTHD
ncbi:alpha-2-macroglobulin family protein [Dokdonella sp. MW10]|uniref:alpha-2-macroglobulin family protein n=1 Tax=Dokdonella sp. MW10 TaxID=2992926 RepID=UPI003F7ED4D0